MHRQVPALETTSRQHPRAPSTSQSPAGSNGPTASQGRVHPDATLPFVAEHETKAARNNAGRKKQDTYFANLAGVADSSRLHRLFNIAVALAGLVLALPLLVVSALLVKLTSPGPAFFVQTRIGMDRRNGGVPRSDCRRQVDRGGKPFRLYKLRSMQVNGSDTDEDEEEVWAAPDDPRVTRIGSFLRKYRIDEIPQLVNVLRGDMNVVGPRPEQPQIFARLRAELEGYGHRQVVRPGITGWAQVKHHYDMDIEDVRRKLNLDLEYIRRRSILEDMQILARTVPVVLLRRGAW